MTDPIADMLTRIRNAVGSRHPRLDMPHSKMKLALAGILKAEGYISGVAMGIWRSPLERSGRRSQP